MLALTPNRIGLEVASSVENLLLSRSRECAVLAHSERPTRLEVTGDHPRKTVPLVRGREIQFRFRDCVPTFRHDGSYREVDPVRLVRQWRVLGR